MQKPPPLMLWDRVRLISVAITVTCIIAAVLSIAAYHFGGVKDSIRQAKHQATVLDGMQGADRMAEVANAGSSVEAELVRARHDREGRTVTKPDIPILYRIIQSYPWILATSLLTGTIWYISKRMAGQNHISRT